MEKENEVKLASLIISIIILIIVIILIIIVCCNWGNNNTQQPIIQNPQAAALAAAMYKNNQRGVIKNNFCSMVTDLACCERPNGAKCSYRTDVHGTQVGVGTCENSACVNATFQCYFEQNGAKCGDDNMGTCIDQECFVDGVKLPAPVY